MRIVNVEQMRRLEALAVEAGASWEALMENAGQGAARKIIERIEVQDRRCVVLCGKGNNGGDGLVVARVLHQAGAQCSVYLLQGKPATPQSQYMYEQAAAAGVAVLDGPSQRESMLAEIARADLLVDAVYGVSFHGELPALVAQAAQAAAESRVYVVALDVPSGADADSGRVSPHCFRADYTMTMEAVKAGLLSYPLAGYVGEICVVPIGVLDECYERLEETCFAPDMMDVSLALPVRDDNSHKGSFGKVLTVCGSVGMSGAALMSSEAAYHSGAGLVQMALPRSLVLPLSARITEQTLLGFDETADGTFAACSIQSLLAAADGASVCVLGCGLGQNEETKTVVRSMIEHTQARLVLDADGLNAIADDPGILRKARRTPVITPHPGEMARLVGKSTADVQADRLETAAAFARAYGVVTVLKGARTVIAAPDGRLYINRSGNAGMAKGGMGDVLAGVIGGFLAQGISPERAAWMACYLHGLAGDRAVRRTSRYGLLARDLLTALPCVLREAEVLAGR